MCKNEIQKLKDKIALCEAERKKMKAKYFDLLTENLKKDVEITEMEKKIHPSIFDGFENEFSTDSMEQIRLIELVQEEDSAFVLAAMRGLYDGKLDVLSKKTVTGRSKIGGKEPISPEKLSIIKTLFNKRVEINSINSIERKKKINKHVKTAIENINKAEN